MLSAVICSLVVSAGHSHMDYCGNTAMGYHVAQTAYAVSVSEEEIHVIPSALWILGCIQEQRAEDQKVSRHRGLQQKYQLEMLS